MSADSSFRMTVVDVFNYPGQGTVVTGQIQSGTIRVMAEITIEGQSSSGKAIVTDVRVAGMKRVEQAQADDIVSLLLRGLAGSGRQEVQPGDLLIRGTVPSDTDRRD